MAFQTRRASFLSTEVLPFATRDTVAADTPARRATCRMSIPDPRVFFTELSCDPISLRQRSMGPVAAKLNRITKKVSGDYLNRLRTKKREGEQIRDLLPVIIIIVRKAK